MRAGKLRGVLAIERKVQLGVDSLNAPLMVWQVWREPFCEIEVRRGREHFDVSSKQRFSEEVYRFCVRYDEITGIDASMRVVYEEAVYDIKAILPDQQRRVDCIIECTLQDVIVDGKPLRGLIKGKIPAGKVGAVFAGLTISAEGGLEPRTFFSGTNLPAGLTLNRSTGAVTGTPSASGTFNAIFGVVDAAGDRHVLPPVALRIES